MMTALQIATASFAVPKSVMNTITGCVEAVCAGVSLPLGRVPQLASSNAQTHKVALAAARHRKRVASRLRNDCSALFVQSCTSAFFGITIEMPSRGFRFEFLPQKLGKSIANRDDAAEKISLGIGWD